MPVIKSAIKKMRQDKKRTAINKNKKNRLKQAIKLAHQKPNKKNLSAAFSLLDKSAKTHLIHKKKAARLKSKLSKLIKEPKETKGTLLRPVLDGTGLRKDTAKVKKTSTKKRRVKKSI